MVGLEKTLTWVWMRVFLETVLEVASKELPTGFSELSGEAQLENSHSRVQTPASSSQSWREGLV